MRIHHIDPKDKIDGIIEFNGYLDNENNFIMKECFIISIMLDNNNPIEKLFIFKESNILDHVDSVKQNKINEYIEKYGINWKTGWYRKKIQKTILKRYLKFFKLIYVRDPQKHDLLVSIVGKRVEINCLSDLGYTEIESARTERCGYHENPDFTECAREEAIKMRLWLTPLIKSLKLKKSDRKNEIHDHIIQLHETNSALPF
ncbi:MdBV-1-6 [Microplitis demolitor]|nr:MdBV-1-6 [Microplitis demolitor]